MKQVGRIIFRAFALGSMFSVLCPLLFAQPKTIRVPQDQATIQAAIDAAANGDTVLVDEGTYFVNLLLTKKIVLASRYILDSDTSHISKTILDGSSPADTNAAAVILVRPGTDAATLITGFTLRGGRGHRTYDASSGTYWRMGGAVFIGGGGASIRNNIIRDNWMSSSIDGASGGGIGMWPIEGAINPWDIRDNLFFNNRAITLSTSTALAAEGGGVYAFGSGTFIGNTVDSNVVQGPVNARGGGVFLVNANGYGAASVEVRNNRFRRNHSSFNGGAIYVWGGSTAPIDAQFVGNLIVENSSIRHGGAFFVNSYSTVTLANNTVANNSTGNTSSGLIAYGTSEISSHPNVRGINNIFWNPGSFPNEIWGVDWNSFHHNLIRGASLLGTNNFSADPQFLSDGSYQLAPGSPCIGAGVPSYAFTDEVVAAPTSDLTGAAIPQPAGAMPDLGAIESDAATSPALRPNRAEAHRFTYDGIPRWYGVVRPLGRESESGRPVLLWLPGYGSTADGDMNYMQHYLHADTAGYLTVYAEGHQRRWNSGITRGSSFPTPSVNDVGYISALIDTLRNRYAIDTNRVFVAGFSNGGFMAYFLAAALPHKIAGAVAVGARLPVSISNLVSSSRPRIPLLIVNGTNDVTVRYDQYYTEWLTVAATLTFWRVHNGATTVSDTRIIDGVGTDGSSVNRYVYGAELPSDARGLKPQIWFYEIYLGGHEWPGAPAYYGSTVINRDISMNEEMFKFFGQTTTDIGDGQDGEVIFPAEFSLDQNYPNPFNPSTTIRFALPHEARVRLVVCNVLGQTIVELVNERLTPGMKQVTWTAAVPSGVYLYTIEADDGAGHRFRETKRMLLLK